MSFICVINTCSKALSNHVSVIKNTLQVLVQPVKHWRGGGDKDDKLKMKDTQCNERSPVCTKDATPTSPERITLLYDPKSLLWG